MSRHVRWRARARRVQRSPGVEGGWFAGLELERDGERVPEGSPEGDPGSVPGGVPRGIGDGTRAVVWDRERALRTLQMARARRLAIALGASGQVARSR